MMYDKNGNVIYTKRDALKIIIDNSKLFRDNLENKELLFLCKNKKKIIYYRVNFHAWNYLHFTGVFTPLKPVVFYNRALNNTLMESEFNFKDRFTTFKKYEILPAALNIHKNARMIGDYGNQGIKIKADMGVGNVNYVMTLDKADDVSCYPKGIVRDDVRVVTNNTSPIFAILTKNIRDELFEKLTYKSKSINTENIHLPKELTRIISNEALLQIKPNIDLSKKAEG
ncbi:MAG: PBECR4 domain-containing protein [Clostridiales bacterium]|nr:PBECR4 domain-containing protein [Clostridiales bacterium]